MCHQDRNNQTPIMVAKRNNRHEIIPLLVEAGAKVLNEEHYEKISQKIGGRKVRDETKKEKFIPIKKEKSEKVPDRKTAKKWCLTVLKEGQYQQLTEEEMAQFEEENPHVAQYMQDPVVLETLQIPKGLENSILYESWDRVAKRLLNQLWRFSTSKIFHEPVDPEKLNIPDYFDYIKNPVDFGTIRQRLEANHYHTLQEFLDDMQLVFDNCMLYNGEDS